MAKKSFKLKSGNTTPFKKMGSSPVKQVMGGGPGEAVEHWKKYKAKKQAFKKFDKWHKTITDKPGGLVKSNISKTPATTLQTTTKAFSNVPKQFVKQAAKQTVGKVASRLAGPVGLGLLAGDVLKTGVKRVAKGIKTGKPQTKLKGKNIKDTFKRVEKKKYI